MSDVIPDTWRSIFAPRDRRPIYEWGADNVNLTPPITKTGAFDVSGSRHFIKIFDALQDDHCREVNILKPVRGGGSLIGDVFCPWTFCNDPGQYMDIFQTDKVAEEHGQSRIHPIFNGCDKIVELLPTNPHENCDAYIKFGTGHEWYLSGPGLANLQTKGIRYMRLEEVWMWPQGRMNEALGRLGDYVKMQTSKAVCISQGGPMDNVPMVESDWYRHYHRGEIWEWEVQCQSCGKYFDAVFSGARDDGSFWGITWDQHKLPNGDWNIPKCIPSIRFECPHCAHPHLDGARTKSEWNRTGQYRLTTEPNRKRQSYHWESVVDYPWAELVELWLDACNAEKRGDLKPKLQFYQKRRAQFKDIEALLKSGVNLTRAAYDVTSSELGSMVLTGDRQEDEKIWYKVAAWSEGKGRLVEFGYVYGFAEFNEIALRYKIPTFLTGKVSHVGLDSGYLPKGDNGVYRACIKYGWIALRGDKAYEFIHTLKNGRKVTRSYSELGWKDPETGTGGANRKYCPYIKFSKFQMNQKSQELIDAGRWVVPVNWKNSEMEKEYAQQMASRVKITEYTPKHRETNVYFREGRNDHARDLLNEQCAFAILMDLIPDPVTERLSESEKKEAA